MDYFLLFLSLPLLTSFLADKHNLILKIITKNKYTRNSTKFKIKRIASAGIAKRFLLFPECASPLIMADGPGPPVQPLFLTKNELESDHGQPPRSPVVCPLLPALGETMDNKRENQHREVDGTVGELQAAFEPGIEEE